MKTLLKNVIISLLIITVAIIIYYLFISSRPIATAKQESVTLPVVNISKLSSVNYLLNIKTYGEIVSERILNIKYSK